MVALIIVAGYIFWCLSRMHSHAKMYEFTWRTVVVMYFSPVVDSLSFVGRMARTVQNELWHY